MNYYIRFFDKEALLSSYEDVLAFLVNCDFEIDEKVMQPLMDELFDYLNSNNNHPKRFKLSSKVYFIIIKTDVNTMEEFKSVGAAKAAAKEEIAILENVEEVEKREGWYECNIKFKRVVENPITHKCEIKDTKFISKVYGDCIEECYNKVVKYLQNRQDIDSRSQYPSIKGKNFTCNFIEETIQ